MVVASVGDGEASPVSSRVLACGLSVIVEVEVSRGWRGVFSFGYSNA